MKIAFATTQTLKGSTVIGRVIPLARELSRKYEIHVLLHALNSQQKHNEEKLTLHYIGYDPFTRTARGKNRKSGPALILRMLNNSVKTVIALAKIKPDIVIIVKPLPQNVLAVRIWHIFNSKQKIVLDADDFELTANLLTSIIQRAAIHWSQRTALRVADKIITASPFLSDHFEQLVSHKKTAHLIPTGLNYKGANVKQENTTPASPVELLYIGSLSESSGHRINLLPEIMGHIVNRISSDIILRIAGDGDDMSNLKKKFEENKLSDSVIWHGRFQVDQIHNFLTARTIIIDPIDNTINNRAKSSFRVALAAATGLPVVSSNIGIRPYLLPDSLHKRFFAEPDNSVSYADKIIDLINRPLTQEDSLNLKNHAKLNTWQHLANKYDSLINN